jgi:hypothetical protein
MLINKKEITVRLRSGKVAFYDPISNVHLTISRREAVIKPGTDVEGLSRSYYIDERLRSFDVVGGKLPKIEKDKEESKEEKSDVKDESNEDADKKKRGKQKTTSE